MREPLSAARKASYALFVLSLFLVARFDLGACLLSGLVSYMIMDLTEKRLAALGARPVVARGAAVAVFAVAASALGWVFFNFLRVGVARLPQLLDTVLPRLAALFTEHGLEFPVENALEARDLLVSWARGNASSLGKTSGFLTRGFFHVVTGMVAAGLRFVTPLVPDDGTNLHAALRRESAARVSTFVRSFERVVGAQLTISVVNTALTGIFLAAAGFPMRTFLVLTTFVCGLVPILGNVVSNAVIVTAGLTVSPHLAGLGLAYLVVLHKLEYLLNSRIVGGSIDTPMWATLLGLVVGEALMGVPGVLLAPALIHYAREELRAVPAA